MPSTANARSITGCPSAGLPPRLLRPPSDAGASGFGVLALGADRLLLTTGGLSNVLRRLDARGLVSRVPDPVDRRSHNVRRTLTGVSTALDTTSAVTTAIHRTLSAVPSTTLLDALHQLRSVLGAVGDAPLATPTVRQTLDARAPETPGSPPPPRAGRTVA
ncbi:MarR family winged helix-turn-helix transcriptional regulator [Streptomyces sp. NPDC102360]|uniref:MarR family winged helix-turn-helix transcriptional regulator n=1 Tax=Streptomyces sp. NPDC102360 TaxID=3366160 RepID=UPI00381273CE